MEGGSSEQAWEIYLLIVDVTVCKVTPVILHGVVSPEMFREGVHASWAWPAKTMSWIPHSDLPLRSVPRLPMVFDHQSDHHRELTIRERLGVAPAVRAAPAEC